MSTESPQGESEKGSDNSPTARLVVLLQKLTLARFTSKPRMLSSMIQPMTSQPTASSSIRFGMWQSWESNRQDGWPGSSGESWLQETQPPYPPRSWSCCCGDDPEPSDKAPGLRSTSGLVSISERDLTQAVRAAQMLMC